MVIRNNATRKTVTIKADVWNKLKPNFKKLFTVVSYDDVSNQTVEVKKESFEKPETGEKPRKRKGKK